MVSLQEMKSSKYKVVSIVLLLLCVVVLFIHPFKKNIWDSNLKLLEKEILSLNAADDKVNLSTFTPFEWDKVYSFAPYLSKEEIYETIGYKWDNISETVSEGMNQVVFAKEGKVVCHLYGYPENNKYGIFFDSKNFKENVTILSSKDNDIFDVTKNGDVVYLTQSE